MIPADNESMDWLKRAYLAARYPKPGRYGIPGLQYSEHDAQRALRIAEAFIKWASNVEDMPDMLVEDASWKGDMSMDEIRKRRWASVAETAGLPTADIKQINEAQAIVREQRQADKKKEKK